MVRSPHARPGPRARSGSLSKTAKRVAAGTSARLRETAAAYGPGRGGDALHDLRVALRRASAAGALFHGFPEKGDGKEVDRLARGIRRALSEAREREVSARLVEKLAREHAEGEAHAPEDLGLAPAPELPDVRADTSRLVDGMEAWSGRLAAWRPDAAAEKRLEKKTRKRLGRARRRVLEIGPPGKKTLHRLRVAAKKLRYALELVASAPGGKRAPALPGVPADAAELVEASKKLQDALGDANDWAALARSLRVARRGAFGGKRDAIDRLSSVVEAEGQRALGKARREARRFFEIVKASPGEAAAAPA